MFPLVQSGRPASEPTFHAETISHVETEKGDVCGTRSQLQGLHAMEDTVKLGCSRFRGKKECGWDQNQKSIRGYQRHAP
jgi:hypothetical protein